ncbi:MAG TPA: dihydroneopterin triphosphate diphosphatase [Casimicrobiaceae bacterium]|jgi:dATP pyrophosphohydrolase|nr:dihydroneopterin triphosphate diphosphatase [Casimicrobiaceae bacterium]
MESPGSKQPVSALVIVYTAELHVLLLERADFPDHWQSVTGSRDQDETLADTATRELLEETGIEAEAFGGVVDWHVSRDYEIYPQWRHRYPAGTTMNTEHVFSVDVRQPVPIRLATREHLRYVWLPWRAAAERCFSWTNRDAILALPEFVERRQRGRTEA